MKLVVCADGTWDDEDRAGRPSNVVKMHRGLKTFHVEGVSQWVYYHSGVGTSWGEWFRGGAFGFGIKRNLQQCYEFLVEHYEQGAELYLFGFSRGAYTVRSLAGLIRNSGIVRDKKDVPQAIELYRSRRRANHPAEPAAVAFRRRYSHPIPAPLGADGKRIEDQEGSPPIKCIGVWDTVGALGIPLVGGRILKPLFSRIGMNWWFHDVRLSTTVEYAYQALAIHERRGDFKPTMWEKQLKPNGDAEAPQQTLEQVWFPGVHCDVGGGYGSSGLSDISLLWMKEKAHACGLEFRDDLFERGQGVALDPVGRRHNSFTGIFLLLDVLRFRWRGRSRDFRPTPQHCESIADTALTRYHWMNHDKWPTTDDPDNSFSHILAAAHAAWKPGASPHLRLTPVRQYLSSPPNPSVPPIP